jgi:hypothetical protein
LCRIQIVYSASHSNGVVLGGECRSWVFASRVQPLMNAPEIGFSSLKSPKLLIDNTHRLASAEAYSFSVESSIIES